MSARFELSSGRTIALDGRWSLLSTAPGRATTPSGLRALVGRPPGTAEPSRGTSVTDERWQRIPGPSTVAAALRAIGAWSLEGPPRRFDAEDWWFHAAFDRPPGSARERRWHFDGLAGLAEVWLGDRPLLASRNTHRAWAIDLPPEDVPAAHELWMRFASIDRALEGRRPRPRWRASMVETQALREIRAPLVGRTPGWSPPAAPVGPWRGVRLSNDRHVDVDDLRLRVTVEGTTGRLELGFRLRPLAPGLRVERIELELVRGHAEHRVSIAAAPGERQALVLEQPGVDLWWPHTHGDPALYRARAWIHREAGAPIELDLGAIGFRTIAIDTAGGGFAVSVNGLPVFCRGACWLPIDPVGLDAPPEATLATVTTARDAGLNMLRVSGAGIYADDALLDACDALGVLVWHDLAFASMDYPAHDPAFLAEVRAEVAGQLDRWQGRPSLAVVCGNSEVEQQASMWGVPDAGQAHGLFDLTLAELCRGRLPGSVYWPSSAHGGAFPHQPNAGTCSYYGVGAYRRPVDDARRSALRFATECLGFANVPCDATLARVPGGPDLQVHQAAWKARSPRDLGAGWDFDDIRDAYLAMLYRVDPVALRSTDPPRYLELSRAVSAEVIEAAFAEWRRPGSSCRGALVWTLRDLWAGAGWGLLDDTGAPKAAYFGLRRGAAPVAIFLSDEGGSGLELQIVNDPPRRLAGRVEVTVHRDDGLRLEAAGREIELPPHGALALPVAALLDRFIDLNHAYRFGPAGHALVVARLVDAAGERLGEAFHFVGGLPNERRRDVGLEIREVQRLDDGSIELSVASRGCAQSVGFDLPGFLPTDAGFHLAPASVRRVRLVRAPAAHGRPARHGRVTALNAWDTPSFEVPA